MIRLTLILVAILFVAFQFWGKDLTEAEKAALKANASDSAEQAPARVEPETRVSDEIRPLNPLTVDDEDKKIPSILSPRVISEENVTRPEAVPVAEPTGPEVPDTSGEDGLPEGDGLVAADPAPMITPEVWYVLGDRVNVRAGQSTDFAVVGQVFFAEPITILTAPEAEWVNIRLSDGTEAWIASQFLSPVPPE